ncbi:MAG: DUF2029 domain-containing protein [Candidatus Hydrogenedentes bacterium]|nr:DUF2029 domain-containing protein [Candidatus Hydrogenedentota bacterium]
MGNRGVRILWLASGFTLLVCMAALLALSRRFPYGANMADRPILLLVALLIAASLPYFASILLALKRGPVACLLPWIFLCGLGMRALLLPSAPILEDDSFRYLWDGAVTANGFNPYAYVPDDLLQGEGAPDRLRQLASEAGIIFQRINHPWLSTIYPPGAQFIFAIAHTLVPWSLAALKFLYLVIDVCTFTVLLRALHATGLPATHVVIYWWNPLLIKEFYNSAHMDVLLMPLLAALLLAMLTNSAWRGGLLLSLAMATKIWPVLFAPLLTCACARSNLWRAILAVCALGAGAALLVPLAASRVHGEASGLAAYGNGWEMNDALFMLFPWLTAQGSSLFGGDLAPALAHRAGRMAATGIVAFVMLWQALRWVRVEQGQVHRNAFLPRALLIITATLFLVSPTQFPWYFSWMLPFLVFVPSPGLLLLTATLPLYYLRFYLDARDHVALFHHGVVWIEFVPVWLVLAWAWWRARSASKHADRHADAMQNFAAPLAGSDPS